MLRLLKHPWHPLQLFLKFCRLLQSCHRNTETSLPSETPTPTSTETPFPTATQEIPAGEFSWRVSVEVPIQSAELSSFGGVSGAEAQLEDTLQTEITDGDVAIGVDTTRITNSSATYTVELEGSGGIDQFIQTMYSDLDGRLNLLNGPIQLKISGLLKQDRSFPSSLKAISPPGISGNW